MELIELVSPQIAVPVIGVVVCAIMVFAFGFRSPVQPPSFDFEEEKRSKRRTRQTKSKGPINGHVTTNEPASEVVPKTTPKPVKEVKAAPSPKAKLSESKNVTKKEVKQDVKGDKKGKPKKEAVQEDIKAQGGKRNKTAPIKKETEDDGEWTTIQVSKKSKKQKPSNKKDGGQAESAVEPESETETSPVVVSDAAAASSPSVNSEVEESYSPVSRTRKNKKEKLTGKNQAEDKEEPPVVSVSEKPEFASSVTAHVQEQGDGKRKKTKKDKKSSASGADAAASAAENIHQDVASASGKVAKKESSPEPVPTPIFAHVAETEQAKPSPKKKKSKGKENIQEDKDVKASDVQLKQVEKAPESIKKNADIVKRVEKSSEHVKKSADIGKHVEKSAEPVKKNADIVKHVEKSAEPVKKNADIVKQVEKSAESVKKDADILKQVEKSAESVKKESEKKKTKTPSKALKVEPEISTAPVSVTESEEAAAATNQAPAGISFDEVGDSWQEAAPKSKKKKPRRDN